MINIKKITIIFCFLLLGISKSNSEIKDALFMTIGEKAIAASDIVNEIKIILILNNQSYSEEIKERLHKTAVNAIIKRNIKQIELERNNYFEMNQQDFINELNRLANLINVDLETFKNICATNELEFSIIEDQVKVELYWNSLIFQLYKDRLKIDLDDINEELKKNKKIEEYLISEILIRTPAQSTLEIEIENLKKKIETEGFENVAKSSSISESSFNGGDLGWININIISEKVKDVITKTPIGKLSDPIELPEGILLYKIRDKRKIDDNLNIEERKNLLVRSEKQKILQMHSLSHYDKVKRSISIKYFE